MEQIAINPCTELLEDTAFLCNILVDAIQTQHCDKRHLEWPYMCYPCVLFRIGGTNDYVLRNLVDNWRIAHKPCPGRIPMAEAVPRLHSVDITFIVTCQEKPTIIASFF